MPIPLNGLPSGAGFWLVFYAVVGLSAGFGASLISFGIAFVTGYGTVTFDSSSREGVAEEQSVSSGGRFRSHVRNGTVLGGLYAVVFGGTLITLEWWYTVILDVPAAFSLYVPAIVTTAVVSIGWITLGLICARLRGRQSQREPQYKSVSTLTVDIGVFLLSFVVLLPIGFLVLFVGLFY